MNNNQANKEPLNKKQRKLAADNHDLIYAYAHKKNISIDDYYDILAIGLCNAARIFNENKGMFSTIAYRCMENELYTYWKSMQKQSVVPSELIFSYDAPSDSGSFLENFIDNYANEETINDIMLSGFVGTLTEKEKTIINLLINGLTHKEIANIMNCQRQNVYYYLKHIRSKAVDYFNYN